MMKSNAFLSLHDFGETEDYSRSPNSSLITAIITIKINDTDESNHSYFNSIHDGGEEENVTTPVNYTYGVDYPQNMIAFGAICMILIDILAIVANFISIWALSKSKRLRRVTTAFVVNLCVADFFLSFCALTSSVVVYRTLNWNGGDKTCKFYQVLTIFFHSASMLTVTTITLNRYVLIVHPRFYHTIFSKRNTTIMIGSLWTTCMVLVLLRYFKMWGELGYDVDTAECAKMDGNGHVEIYMFILTYIAPLIVFIVCYAKMFYVVRKTEKNTLNRGGSIMEYVTKLNDKYWLHKEENGLHGTCNKHLRNEKERRLFKMIFVIFVCFILCFIPVIAMKISRKEKDYPSLYILCHLGLHLSNVVNPIIYIVMSKEYRKAYTDLFRCTAKIDEL